MGAQRNAPHMAGVDLMANPNPIRNHGQIDRRYSIAREFTGHEKPQWVARFDGEFIAASGFYSSALARAVGHNAIRKGAPVIVGQPFS